MVSLHRLNRSGCSVAQRIMNIHYQIKIIKVYIYIMEFYHFNVLFSTSRFTGITLAWTYLIAILICNHIYQLCILIISDSLRSGSYKPDRNHDKVHDKIFT